jgi:transketolase
VIVIEEHSELGGLAAQVKQIAWDRRASCDLRTFSLKDEFIHIFGSHADLLAAHGLSAGRIAEAVMNRPTSRD